jgi:ATP-dependent exoDNAse (exonuclease V) alpha subunit
MAVVEYYDYISSRNFYILYRVEVNNFITSNEGTVFKGDDITKLNLFYAGTCHKLQGSQAKIIICPLDTVNYSGFITRQMLYTEVTRGEKLVFMLGSVDNSPTSMLTRARKDIASVSTLTVGEIIV